MATTTFSFGHSTYTIDVEPKKSITVIRDSNSPNKFVIGDMAEYDSYNLSYYGEILSITDKTVTIKPRYGNKNVRLKLESFAWRNYNFDLNDTVQKNSDTMMYI